MFQVSQSKVGVWRRCYYAYHLKYVQKLRKNKKSRPLVFGTIVHEMHDAYSNGDDPFAVLKKWDKENQKLFIQEREAYGEILEDIRILYTEYLLAHPEKEWMTVRIKKKSAEHEFSVPLGNRILFVGKIDKVVKAKGLRWLAEHKTFTRMPNDDVRWRSIQSASYIAAMRIMGWPEVDGTCWDYFKSKPPSEPAFLKDGSLSAKNIDTLPTKVLEFAKQHKINVKTLSPLLKKAEERRPDYFPRVYTLIKPRVVDAVMTDFIATANDMADNHERRREKHIGPHCSWCDFELICRAELQGLDVKSIRSSNYHVSKREDKEKPEIQAE